MEQDINKLTKDNKGLVYKQLNHMKLAGDVEAESIAYEALWRAIVDYDESTGYKLSTLATVYIYNALGGYLRSLNRKRQIKTVSYNCKIQIGKDGDECELLDVLESDESIEGDYIMKERCRYALAAFEDEYNKLKSEPQKAILKYWKDSDFTLSTVQIAELSGVSQSYVSRVLSAFKYRLRQRFNKVY